MTAVPASFSEQRLGEILLARGVIDDEILGATLSMQAERGGRLGELLISQKGVAEKHILMALGEQLSLPMRAQLDDKSIPDALINAVPINFAKQYRMVPLGTTDDGQVR